MKDYVVKKVITRASIGIIALAGGSLVYNNYQTRSHLTEYHQKLHTTAFASAPTWQLAKTLPAPVERYIRFTFPNGVPALAVTEVTMRGDFRLPQHQDFNPTTARQSLSPALPALVFEAKTPIYPGIWALAYDAYLNGEMEMKAKLFAALTVMDQPQSVELNRISLRRWLLESPLYPQALLPGKYTRWEAIDNTHARVIAEYQGLRTSMIAEIDNEGRLSSLRAENDGDLNTPYHGSGEYAARSDYRLINGMMIPHKFTIARHARGVDYPFWRGELTSYSASLYPQQ
ncbi:DUF6920 family protein [Marinobacterium jannaschii]|uniref:DUF6920 family protein n=1 Tax=Marinobacterium jannaschii TaxID=64970 RepID=UPI0005689241|nr:DUF6544 family protein [Marinobacterium jannaschii]